MRPLLVLGRGGSPGGADRRLVRVDGVWQRDMLHAMRAEDGAVITARDHVPITDLADGSRHAAPTPEITMKARTPR